MTNGPRILAFDIETSPNLAHVWDIWRAPIGPKQVLDMWDMMCWSAKWVGEGTPVFHRSEHFDGYQNMLGTIHSLLDQADMVLTYNGKRFDMPRVRTLFALEGYGPFAEPRHIDLDTTMKRVFDFPSHSLDFTSKAFGFEGKHTTGYELWRRCLIDNDPEAWKEMIAYCDNDVELLEKLYYKVLPWIDKHPSVTPFLDEAALACTKCGSTNLAKDGFAYTNVSIYQRYRCLSCGNRALRGTARVNTGGTGITEAGI